MSEYRWFETMRRLGSLQKRRVHLPRVLRLVGLTSWVIVENDRTRRGPDGRRECVETVFWWFAPTWALGLLRRVYPRRST